MHSMCFVSLEGSVGLLIMLMYDTDIVIRRTVKVSYCCMIWWVTTVLMGHICKFLRLI